MPKALPTNTKALPALPLSGCGANASATTVAASTNGGPATIRAMLKIGEQVGTFGPESAWKIYHAQRRSPVCEDVSLFIFEKRTAEKLHKPKRKGTITELYKRGFKQLERLHHARFLKIILPLEETPDALMVVTEPVIGSLADIIQPINCHDRNGSSRILVDKLTDCPLLDLEIKCGLAQITEGLIHLHATEHCMHANVCPESILVTANGGWKLAGMEFAEKSPDRVDSFPSIRWSSKYPKLGQPNLNFIAPEVQLESFCSTTSDLFSLGMTICAIYNQGKSLLDSDHSASIYEQKLTHLNFHAHEFVTQMPGSLREAVETLLQRDPRERPTAQLFSLTKYFNDPALTCLRRLDYIDQMFPSQKAEFYPSLAATLYTIPRKLWQSRILPALAEDLNKPDFAPYGLYPLAYMIEHSDKLDYEELYRPCVDPIFDWPNKSPETQVILLRNLSTFAKFAHPLQVPTHLVHILENALTSTHPDVLEAGVMCFGKFYTIIRDESTKTHLFQSLKSLFGKRTDYSIKVQAALIASLEKIVDHLTKSFVMEDIIPIITEERLTYAVDTVGALIDFYRHVLKDARFGVNPDHMTRYILPTVLPLLTHPDLTKEQYVSLETFIKDLLFQIEKTQRGKFKLEPALMLTIQPNGGAGPGNGGPNHAPFGQGGRPFDGNGLCSANNSRRSSMNSHTDVPVGGKVYGNGCINGPHISIFTTGDGSNASSRSSSPSRSSRRSSYNNSFNSAATGGPGEIRGRAASSSFLNVTLDDATGKSKTSPTTPERRGSFFTFQGLSPALSPNQRRHSAVSIQAISSQMVSLFAGRS
ncbi:SCY1-like protein 2 [Hypsibius exemplaris]|uniref:SCY1-like protein 2 n=1 Tax=Hypsibius exemplaris TaxID=2072580 RepID=A0A1W0WMA1_HYPEX|nr:SCY1-like protein 2 [Hypsibius exemplaris]